MTLKDIKKKYKGYFIGQRIYERATPFMLLEGITEDTEIKGYRVEEKPIKNVDISDVVVGGKKKPTKYYKGYVVVWYK